MTVHLIFGGPGTGKTTYLASLFKQCVDKYGLERVRFISFTRSQVYRDRRQAAKKIGMKYSEMKGFSTLHSAGMKSYGKAGAEIIDRFEQHHLSEFLGVEMENVINGYDYMKSTGSKNFAVGANKAGMSTKLFAKCVYFYEKIKELKNKKQATVDFSDMLHHAIETKFSFDDCDVVFVDEAQDLSALQWQAVYTLFKNVKELYVAGDPNQALYGFSGGLSDYMNEMRFDTIKYLDRSFRCSSSVMEAANIVAREIRKAKQPPASNGRADGFAVYYPKSDLNAAFMGAVKSIMNKSRTVLFLAYTYDQLVKVEDALFYPSGREYNADGTLKRPFRYSFVSGREKRIDAKKSKVTLSTIHQAKGLEADYVFINISSGRGHNLSAEYKDLTRHQDDYNKAMYVAITRARIGVVFFEMSPHTAAEPTLYDKLYYTNIGREYYDLLVKHRLDSRIAKRLKKARRGNRR